MDEMKIKNGSSFIASLKDGANFPRLDNRYFLEKTPNKKRMKLASDFAIYNSCSTMLRDNKYYGSYALNVIDYDNRYYSNVDHNGELNIYVNTAITNGLCPIINCDIPSEEDLNKYKNNFKEFKKIFGLFKNRKPCIQLGNYPQKKVSDDFNKKLERLYNDGSLSNSLNYTGKTYYLNTTTETKNKLSKLCPEFEYEGKRYVRFHSNANIYLNGTSSYDCKPNWFEVSPVTFIVKNWKNFPRNINPFGNGSAKKMDIQTRDILIAGVPFKKYDAISVDIDSYLTNLVKDILDFNSKTEKYVIPQDETEIADYAFEGCLSLNEVVIHKNIKRIGQHAFTGCKFKYAYIDNESQNIVLTNSLPGKDSNYSHLFNFSDAFNTIIDSSYNSFLDFYIDGNDISNIDKYNDLIKRLKINNFTIPFSFILKLENSEIYNNFFNSDFRFLKNELPKLSEELQNCPIKKQIAFWNFANAFGCMSRDEFLDKNGNPTDIYVAQKACSALSKFFKTENLSINKIHKLLDSRSEILPYNNCTCQELIKFMSTQGENGEFDNLKLMILLDAESPGMFADIMTSFDIAKNLRQEKQENGKIKMLSWRDAFIKMHANIVYKNTNNENLDLAKLFYERGLKQKDFDEASMLFKNAKLNKISPQILKKQLKETSFINELEQIKNSTEKELLKSEYLLTQVHNKIFSYEFLNKNDPRNAILGLYCDCCASIGNSFYGSEIARYSIVAKDVQNIVVKNLKGEIIAKSTMYVNKELGYIVLNDFEVSKTYTKNNTECGYYSDDYGINGKSREAIFKAFMRAISDFVEEYNKENPKSPIKQVNVGMEHNKLKKQCDRFKTAKENLNVPSNYSFEDAKSEQKVLFEFK